jgi:hypothetical protein
MRTRSFSASGTTVCVCDPQSSATEAISLMSCRLLMSNTWIPSKPVHGDGAGAQSAPVGLPFWLTAVHWFVRCGESTDLNTRFP